MNQQPSLFDAVKPYAGKAPRVRQSATSTAAAEAIEPKLGSLQLKVLRLLASYGPLSDETIDRLGLARSTLRPRRVELTKAGYVVDSGDRVKGESGLLMTLWTLSEKGKKSSWK
jgi:hypothetical protein